MVPPNGHYELATPDAQKAQVRPAPIVSALQTVTLHIPLLRNPNRFGIRIPVWIGKVVSTIRELQSRVSGFTLSVGLGWCAEDEIWDLHLCADFDVALTLEMESYLIWWQRVLQDRFGQRSIYLKSSSPVSWM
jgi:hypothetical protein